jgi:hypothetical protein
MPKNATMIGQRFGKRVVIAKVQPKWGSRPFWKVRCDCGIESDVFGQSLRDGKANQCRNCQIEQARRQLTTHGQAIPGKRTPTYRSWESMNRRCFCPTSRSWKDYGGRGIGVCDRWMGLQGFENFLTDMGERPLGKTLDRFPNFNGNYEPGNCRWATQKEQVANQRKHGLIEIFTNEELLVELKRRNAI